MIPKKYIAIPLEEAQRLINILNKVEYEKAAPAIEIIKKGIAIDGIEQTKVEAPEPQVE